MAVDLSVTRSPVSRSSASTPFVYEQWGPEVVEISADGDGPGVAWTHTIVPEEGYYRVSISVNKLSGDTDNVRLLAGTVPGVFASSGNHCSGVIPFNPDTDYWVGIQASMDLAETAATIQVSGFICTWT